MSENQQNSQYDEAQRLIKKYLKITAGLGLIPAPAIDSLLISGAQLKLLQGLAKIYGKEFSEHRGKSLIASLLGSVLPLSVTSHLFSLCKGIPFLGQGIGILGMSVFAGASTFALGQVFIQHFETGGTLLDFDPEKMKAYYRKQYEVGKTEVRQSNAGKRP